MPTETHFARLAALVGAVAILVAILLGSPVPLPEGWDKAVHFVAFSALTFLLWHATGGRMLPALAAGLVLFGLLDEWRQAYLPARSPDAADFLADLCAVVTTGALLSMQRKTICAESSPQ